MEVKYILDVRDFSDSPDAALFVKDINVILNDPEVKVVVETIGGTRFAYPYVRQCLESGRSVCTSNKEMVATYAQSCWLLHGSIKQRSCLKPAWVAVPPSLLPCTSALPQTRSARSRAL